jgi:hypothetical protein
VEPRKEEEEEEYICIYLRCGWVCTKYIFQACQSGSLHRTLLFENKLRPLMLAAYPIGRPVLVNYELLVLLICRQNKAGIGAGTAQWYSAGLRLDDLGFESR